MLIYTGGTTGPSKGCMISHNYCCNQAHQTITTSKRTRDEIHYTTLPLYHFNSVSTAIVASSLIGAQVSIGPRFSVTKFWPEIERTGARIVSILGSMPAMVANAPDNDAMKRCFAQLRIVRGGPFPPGIADTFRERFGVKHVGSNCYGLTEATMMTTLSVDEYAKPGSSGKRNDDFEVRIVDDDGQECPVGVAGEIVARPNKPDVMFQGYWRRPEDTVKIMKDLWIHSGDIGKWVLVFRRPEERLSSAARRKYLEFRDGKYLPPASRYRRRRSACRTVRGRRRRYESDLRPQAWS
jgi:crotonobetaine/carnitine-CoA ligase